MYHIYIQYKCVYVCAKGNPLTGVGTEMQMQVLDPQIFDLLSFGAVTILQKDAINSLQPLVILKIPTFHSFSAPLY